MEKDSLRSESCRCQGLEAGLAPGVMARELAGQEQSNLGQWGRQGLGGQQGPHSSQVEANLYSNWSEMS